MNYFKKMIMLPVDEYNTFKSLLYKTQVSVPENTLQIDLEKIKQTYGTNLPDDVRAKLEADIIQKHSSKADKSEPQPVGINPQNIEWIKTSISNFSKSNKNRAERLYKYLIERLPNRWNENGELLTVDGEIIAGSNIIDLVNFVTSINRKERAPYALDDFLQLLHRANIPSHLLSTNAQNILYSTPYIADDDDVEDKHGDSDLEVLATPSKKKRKQKRKLRWDQYE